LRPPEHLVELVIASSDPAMFCPLLGYLRVHRLAFGLLFTGCHLRLIGTFPFKLDYAVCYVPPLFAHICPTEIHCRRRGGQSVHDHPLVKRVIHSWTHPASKSIIVLLTRAIRGQRFPTIVTSRGLPQPPLALKLRIPISISDGTQQGGNSSTPPTPRSD
jgi:hypothetical protein